MGRIKQGEYQTRDGRKVKIIRTGKDYCAGWLYLKDPRHNAMMWCSWDEFGRHVKDSEHKRDLVA